MKRFLHRKYTDMVNTLFSIIYKPFKLEYIIRWKSKMYSSETQLFFIVALVNIIIKYLNMFPILLRIQ